MRIAFENRLQEYLKDPYKSPEVNHELRQRLPRAKKDDPKLIDSSGQIDSDQTEEVIDVMETQQVTQTDRYDTPLSTIYLFLYLLYERFIVKVYSGLTVRRK